MSRPTEKRPATVPVAKQAGDVRARWAWTEPSVWTDRMLNALEKGVKGGKWYSLMDKVYAQANLEAAADRVIANRGAAGVDKETVRQFTRRREPALERVRTWLMRGEYRPQAVRRVWIPKPGRKERRPLGIPTVTDRVVQTALRAVLEPIFERDFATHSYGFRPTRSAKDALRRVDGLLKQGYEVVVDADIKSYFDEIPHEALMREVEAKVSDGRVLDLVRKYLEQGVLEEMQGWVPTQGTPQGAVISPLLANIYLSPLDLLMEQRGMQMVRYADDFVILCRSRAEAERALKLVQRWMEAAGLRMHPDKTRVVHWREEGFEFLGYRFHNGRRWLPKSRLKRIREAVRQKTRRNDGKSMECIIANLNRVLRGWYAYFKHLDHNEFNSLDGFIRRRLRSILRTRQCKGKRRYSKGSDHQRWPNAFFRCLGLFSLAAAWERDVQSATAATH